MGDEMQGFDQIRLTTVDNSLPESQPQQELNSSIDKSSSNKAGWYPGKYLRSASSKVLGTSSTPHASEFENRDDNLDKSEEEDQKKENMIVYVVRSIRQKYLERQLIGNIRIYRLSGIISTALVSNITADDIAASFETIRTKSNPSSSPNHSTIFESDPVIAAELTGQYKRALSMTDMILNSLERRSLAWDGVEFIHDTLLTRGSTMGVSDPIVGFINFTFTIELSATVYSLLKSRKRFEEARSIVLTNEKLNQLIELERKEKERKEYELQKELEKEEKERLLKERQSSFSTSSSSTSSFSFRSTFSFSSPSPISSTSTSTSTLPTSSTSSSSSSTTKSSFFSSFPFSSSSSSSSNTTTSSSSDIFDPSSSLSSSSSYPYNNSDTLLPTLQSFIPPPPPPSSQFLSDSLLPPLSHLPSDPNYSYASSFEIYPSSSDDEDDDEDDDDDNDDVNEEGKEKSMLGNDDNVNHHLSTIAKQEKKKNIKNNRKSKNRKLDSDDDDDDESEGEWKSKIDLDEEITRFRMDSLVEQQHQSQNMTTRSSLEI